jgi:hypothetical protein
VTRSHIVFITEVWIWSAANINALSLPFIGSPCLLSLPLSRVYPLFPLYCTNFPHVASSFSPKVEAASCPLVNLHQTKRRQVPAHNCLYSYKVLKEKIVSNLSWLLMITMLVIKTLMIMMIRKTCEVPVE